MNKKKLSILFIISVAFLIVFAVVYYRSSQPELGATTTVKRGTIQSSIEETGTVFSKRVNTFYSDMSQTIKVLNVSIGDRVKKGDILLTYENNYDLEIEKAKKQLEAITASYNENTKGADFQEVSNEKLNINTIENNLDYAKKNFEKVKSLYENYAVSKAEYEEAENSVKVLENQLQEAKNSYELLIKDVSSNIKHQYEAQIEEIMVQISILEKNKKEASIVADFDGVITELNVDQGGMTKSGVSVVEMQDEKNLGVYVEMLADEVSQVKEGMDFIIKNQNKDTEIDKLTVKRIYPKALAKVSDLGVEQKRVRVEADLKENKGGLKIGAEVDAEIITEQKDNVLLLEKDSVYELSGKKYASVKIGENREEREVTTGLEDDKYVEILSGLTENDQVFVD